MAWANWPATVPQRFKIGTTGTSPSNREEFQPKFGPPKSRPGTIFAERTFEVETTPWTVAEAQAFEEWWSSTLGDGNLVFNGIHPIFRTPVVARIPSWSSQEVALYVVYKLQYIVTFG